MARRVSVKGTNHSKGLRLEMVHQVNRRLSNGLRPETVKERRRIRLSNGLRPEMVWLRHRTSPNQRYTKIKRLMNKEMKECGVSTETMHCDWEENIEDHRGIPEG